MADILLDTQSTPASPASGQGVVYFDSITGCLTTKNSAGFARSFGNSNFSTASQVITATTNTYITGSALAIPSNKMQVGTCFEWVFSMTKTAAAGVSNTIFNVATGTTGTTADTSRLQFTKPAGTAATDEGTVRIFANCRGPLNSSSGVLVGQMTMTHNGNTTGHMTIPVADVNAVSSGFDVTAVNLIVGLFIFTGASDSITLQCVQANAWNL